MNQAKVAKVYDKIILPQLTFMGKHGVFEQEKEEAQEFIIDLTLFLNLSEASLTDDLSQTVDYGQVFLDVKKIVETHSYQLIERLAQVIAEAALDYSRVVKVVVSVEKTAARAQNCYFRAQVSLERSKS